MNVKPIPLKSACSLYPSFFRLWFPYYFFSSSASCSFSESGHRSCSSSLAVCLLRWWGQLIIYENYGLLSLWVIDSILVEPWLLNWTKDWKTCCSVRNKLFVISLPVVRLVSEHLSIGITLEWSSILTWIFLRASSLWSHVYAIFLSAARVIGWGLSDLPVLSSHLTKTMSNLVLFLMTYSSRAGSSKMINLVALLSSGLSVTITLVNSL